MFSYSAIVDKAVLDKSKRRNEEALEGAIDNGNLKMMKEILKRDWRLDITVWHLYQIIRSEKADAISFAFERLAESAVDGTTNPSGRGFPYKELYSEFLSKLLVVPPDDANIEVIVSKLPHGEVLSIPEGKYYPGMLFTKTRDLVMAEYTKYCETVMRPRRI